MRHPTINPLTNRVQRALQRAEEEQGRRHQPALTAEHVLYALLMDSAAVAPKLLGQLGIDVTALSADVDRKLEAPDAPRGGTLDAVLPAADRGADGGRDG